MLGATIYGGLLLVPTPTLCKDWPMLRPSHTWIAAAFAAMALGCVHGSTSSTLEDLTLQARLKRCKTLSEKISTYGPMNAIATSLAGGSGVAAAFKESNTDRETYGILAALFAAAAAWTSYKEKRQLDRYADFNCAALYRVNEADTAFQRAFYQLQFPKDTTRRDTVLSHP
jgi:hypothetical protein